MATGTTEFFDKTLLAGTSGSTEGTYIGEVWSRYLIVQVEKKLGLANLCDRRYESDLAKGGDIIHVPDVSNLAVRTKSENTAISYETVTVTNTNITVNTIKYAAFSVEDVTAGQSMYDIRKLYMPKLSYAIEKDIDSAVASLYSGFTANSNTIGTYNTDIDEDLILLAKQKLDDGDVPASPRYLVIPPRQEAAIRKINRFTNKDYSVADFGGFAKPRPGMFMGSIHGFDIHVSTNLTATGSSVDCAAYHPEAITLVVGKKPDVREFYDMDYFALKIGALYVYGTAEMRDAYGVFIKG